MASGASYDCIVIGGGHNGLVAAAYLARAGRRVCVLERRHVLGGCATTEELWPGYKVSTAAYVISLFLPAIIEELRLREYGLRILRRSPSSFTPLPDGRSLLMGPDGDLNQREISKFSVRDAESFPRYEAMLEGVAAVIEPLLSQTAPDPLPLPSSWRRVGVTKRLRDLRRLWGMYSAAGALGARLPEAIELLTGAARPILDRWFESDALKATLATDAIIGAFLAPSSPGSAYVLMHHVMGEAGGARGVWGYVQGGMGGLATSLERACLDLGVEIRREAPVRRILTVAGRSAARVVGVQLEDGSDLAASAVASSIDPHWTFERLLAADDLPEDFARAVARIDYSSASAKINLALAEPPRFTCLSGMASTGVPPHLNGTIHVSPTMDYIERAFDDAKYGRPSRDPVLELTMPTSVDDTIAPPGRHLVGIFVQYAPYRLKAGAAERSVNMSGRQDAYPASDSWDEVKEAFADRCIEVLAQYAPNVP